MGRRGTQDGTDWRRILHEQKHPLASLPASSQSGQYLSSRGFSRAAEAAFREVLERCPSDRESMEGLAWLLELSGRGEEAIALRREVLESELLQLGVPQEHLETVVQFRLAATGRASVPDRVPEAYVTGLFDNYAEHFDSHLTEVLRYCGPQALAELVQEILGDEAEGLQILDAGCGTGLCGPLLRPLAGRLDGVDLSPGMLEKARQREVYDRLEQGELTAWLAERPADYDLVVAADVLAYFGDLAPLIKNVAAVLRADGLFVASCENTSEPGFVLGGTRRYAHHPQFVRQTAESYGLGEVVARQAVLRYEQFNPVHSTIYAFRRM